jgi:hypothetical protein
VGEIGEQLFAIRKVAQRVGVDDAGADRVDANLPRTQLLRQGAH